MDDEQQRERPAPPLGRAFAVYNLGRLLLFAAATVLLYGLLRVNGLELLLLSLVLSAVLSIVVLRRQREDVGRALAARTTQRAERQAALRARLDEADPQ